jgi:hypothetical protein
VPLRTQRWRNEGLRWSEWRDRELGLGAAMAAAAAALAEGAGARDGERGAGRRACGVSANSQRPIGGAEMAW